MDAIEITTIWRTATEQCELVFHKIAGYRLRLWVEGRLIVDEYMADAAAGIRRAWELRTEWQGLVE
jgi:hypothetical protein